MIQRTIYLGETVEATAGFFEAGAPIQPSNPTTSPVYIVRDIHEDIVTFGVASLGSDNLYHTTITIPTSAVLSEEDKKYVIEWELLSNTGKSYKLAEYFDVVHPNWNVIKEKEIQKITLRSSPLLFGIPLPSEPSSISFELRDINGLIINSGTPTTSGKYSDYLIYNYTVPADIMTEGQDYIGIFNFTLGGEQNIFHQTVHCIDLWALTKLSDMRMYLDKVQKDIDLYTGYRDSDLYYHLRYGLDFLNMIFPTTSWTYATFKGQFAQYVYSLIGCACLSALRAQYLAEGDSAFDYSGQPVSLTVDRTQFIESELGRWESWIDNVLKPWKKDAVKKTQFAGHLGLSFPTVSGYSAMAMNLQYKGFPFRQFYSFARR